jgi:prepilin-type N-terminal cleavage/methylation domain-containing protein
MKEKGFTLIELLIVLAIIAILAAVLIVIIKPGQIFTRARDTQRSGDLRNLSQAVDAYLTELAQDPSMKWPERGNCSSTDPGNIFFSVEPSGSTTSPTGWPNIPSGGEATGTTSQTPDGNGWVPLNFTLVRVLNLNTLPIDPRNGQSGTAADGQSVVFAYSFTCDTNYNYEFAAKLEGNKSAMQNDGGNRNDCASPSPNCLYEVGPGKATLY